MIVAANASVRYGPTLDAYLCGAGETALTEAYELGRQMLCCGLSVLDLANLHNGVLREWLEQHEEADVRKILRSAAIFFTETLSSFDMLFLRSDESATATKRMNDSLEAEVRRISHAIHSEAGAILAQATIGMDQVARTGPYEPQSQMDVVRSLLYETGEKLRHFSHELRPSVLDEFGLMEALEFLAHGVERRTGACVALEGRLDRRVASPIELTVYRVAQEAINNALRHGGQPLNIEVSVEMQEARLRCVVSDDGQGFDVEEVQGKDSGPGIGLLGMRERAALLGGECSIFSSRGDGTTVVLSLPL